MAGTVAGSMPRLGMAKSLSQERRAAWLLEFEEGGLSQEEFRRREDPVYSTVLNWRRRIRNISTQARSLSGFIHPPAGRQFFASAVQSMADSTTRKAAVQTAVLPTGPMTVTDS